LTVYCAVIKCFLFAFAACCTLAAQPNVLLLCVDDLKPALGCYGDPHAKTPNIDRLAAKGMRFDLAYCNQAVCAPSRNNLFLGSRSTSLGIYSLSRNFRDAVPTAVTLPQYFRQHGYRAEAVGKLFHTGHGNQDDAASWSTPTIKEKVVEYLDPKNSANGQLTREEAYFSNQMLERIRSLPRGAATEISEVADSAYADGRIADHGIQKLQAAAQKPGEPFFLALGFVKPHLPFTAPKKYWDMHDPNALPQPERHTPPTGAPDFAGKTTGELNQYEPTPESGPVPPEQVRHLIHGYYAAVSYMDAQLGRVLDALEQTTLGENTLIVLWGDHGWHLGDNGMWTKHTNYEQANRIPLIIVAPQVAAPGSFTRQPAETVDIYPTLVELAGLPAPQVPQPVDGLSLVPVLRDPAARVRAAATHCFPREELMGRAIRTERHRLVEWKRPGAPAEDAILELYDYQTDPDETRNLASEQPDTVAVLHQMLGQQPEAKLPRTRATKGKAKGKE
jgi:iduronate 2-sulfatase